MELSLKLREPFQSASHLIGGLIGLMLFISAFSYSDLGITKVVVLAIYQITFLGIFFASALFHGRFHRNIREESFFEKIDYICIFLFIAGTYTPICFQALESSLATWILSIQWGCAILGMFAIILFGMKARTFLTVIFLIMGWSFLFTIPSMFHFMSTYNLLFLLAGSAFYSVGAAVFSMAPPLICKNKICSHSLWHVFVLLGAYSHMLLISDLIYL